MIKFKLKSGAPEKQRVACLIVAVYKARCLSKTALAIDTASGNYISDVLRRGDIDGDQGQSLLLHNVPGITADRVLLIGCGTEKDIDASRYLQAIEDSSKILQGLNVSEATNYLTELDVCGYEYSWKIKQAILAVANTFYRFDTLKSDKKEKKICLRRLHFFASTQRELNVSKQALQEAIAVTNGLKLARDLANQPGNICTPRYLTNQSKRLVKKYSKANIKVLNEAQMKGLGMGSLLAVAQGSKEPAQLITIKYNNAKKEDKPIVLVGKGVTFDSGGISIKPSAAMDEMKFDMCGAATVLGTLSVIMELQLPVNIVGVIPATENMPGGKAVKPGDIVTSMSGQTIEILNTDAEGRLILCDALSYCAQFNPEVVIDIATLTGACVIALGQHATGLMSNHQPLADTLLAAAEVSNDRAWQLPLWDAYKKQLESPFADVANIGGREGGTITAACFLSRFTEKYRWAHLDIAGTAWKSGREKGATGRPVKMLTQYIIDKIRKGKK